MTGPPVEVERWRAFLSLSLSSSFCQEQLAVVSDWPSLESDFLSFFPSWRCSFAAEARLVLFFVISSSLLLHQVFLVFMHSLSRYLKGNTLLWLTYFFIKILVQHCKGAKRCTWKTRLRRRFLREGPTALILFWNIKNWRNSWIRIIIIKLSPSRII